MIPKQLSDLIELIQGIFTGIVSFFKTIFSLSQSTKPKGRSMAVYQLQSKTPPKAQSRAIVIPVHQYEYSQDELNNAPIYRRTPYPKVKRPISSNQTDMGRESV